jgi:hypothetical protein
MCIRIMFHHKPVIRVTWLYFYLDILCSKRKKHLPKLSHSFSISLTCILGKFFNLICSELRHLFCCSMDSRFTDESIAFSQFATSIFSSGDSHSLEAARQLDEELHMKGNEKLIGTFKGTLKQTLVTINSAGEFRSNIFLV